MNIGIAVLADNPALVEELNAGPVTERGLVMAQSFDASVFINRAIGLVGGNIILGILLAVGILWWFLRRLRRAHG